MKGSNECDKSRPAMPEFYLPAMWPLDLQNAIADWIKRTFDLTPYGIVADLDLARPIYAATAAYGHFGRADADGFFPWESVAKVSVLA